MCKGLIGVLLEFDSGEYEEALVSVYDGVVCVGVYHEPCLPCEPHGAQCRLELHGRLGECGLDGMKRVFRGFRWGSFVDPMVSNPLGKRRDRGSFSKVLGPNSFE